MTRPALSPNRCWLRGLALAALCGLAAPAQAARFELSLDALVGGYTTSGEIVSAEFDFGREFARIDQLSIRLDVEGSAGVCAGFSCVPSTFFEARLDDPGRDLAEGRFRSGQLTPLRRRVVESRFGSTFVESSIDPVTGQIVITDFRRDPEPSFLLDGAARIELALGGFLDPELGLVPSMVPGGQIFAATLVIEGAAIPEPSSALLLSLGGAVIALRLRHDGASSKRSTSG